MSTEYSVLAFDFGASSGRAIKAKYATGSLETKEIHRFENIPITVDNTLCWNFDYLLKEIHNAIDKAEYFDSVAFDTWGVDFGLLDENGKLLLLPVHYRDNRTNGIPEKVFTLIPKEELYRETGNQIMSLNTLFQLVAIKEQHPEILRKAKTLLFMPDLFSYMLSGNVSCEMSIASTSQMLNPNNKSWSSKILEYLELPKTMFLPPVNSGTVTGNYNKSKVIAVAGHDTQSAVAAIPSQNNNIAFLSCGTWSLLGTEIDTPIVTQKSLNLGLSNELGVNGKVNYLKNIIGLWLIQECRREWFRQGQKYSYSDFEELALEAKPFKCFIDPDAPEFTPPGDIPTRVREFCYKTGQSVPETHGEILRCIYESLALKYHYALDQLKFATGKNFNTLHILGGGSKSTILCQFTANSCAIPVVAGPVEATALGNIIVQLTTLGALPNIQEGRNLICKTEKLSHYKSINSHEWDLAFQQYKNIL